MSSKRAFPRAVELLAPARDAVTAIEAIKHGADAVYIGAASHGARSAAGNSLEDIRRVVDYARQFRARVYVTVNTIVYDDEIEQVQRLVWDLWHAGVDALIVQDTALLEMELPPIQLHASTQMDTRDVDKARWLADAGFSQVVIARESTLEQMREICAAVEGKARVEAFVHGALCVSYSGDCRAGWMAQGRSANRGECPQICRQRFDLVDAQGNMIVKGKHLLSLRDLNLSTRVGEMLEAGVSSFKIEGRLKDVAYVKNAVAAYRRVIDRFIAEHPDRWCRASAGRVETKFEPVLSKGFNRGFTSYFADGPRPRGPMASLDTPKMAGERAGIVTDCSGRCIKARLDVQLHNGDGLGFFRRNGEFDGFRVNRTEGNRIYVASDMEIPRGTVLYRNRDKERDDMMAGETARRVIGVAMTLRMAGKRVALEISDDRGCHAVVAQDIEGAEARTPQQEARHRVLSKLGDTIYELSSLDDRLGDCFIPASALTGLRRRAIEALESNARATFVRLKRRPVGHPAVTWTMSSHDNIANRLARRFYHQCGVEAPVEGALEVTPGSRHREETRVMTTRYCVRREVGLCLMTPKGRSLKGALYLVSGPSRYRLDFDCKACRMNVIANPADVH